MKKLFTFAAVVTLSVFVLLPAAPASATVCEAPWGSTAKTAADNTGGSLTNIRTGQHPCFDRMVFDVPGANANTGYRVEYVTNVIADGSGEIIPVSGGAKLQIRIDAPAYNPNTGAPTYSPIWKPSDPAKHRTLPGVNLTGYQTFRDARFAGSFEGQTTVGLGVRARLPFRVMTENNKVIVDVAHLWY